MMLELVILEHLDGLELLAYRLGPSGNSGRSGWSGVSAYSGWSGTSAWSGVSAYSGTSGQAGPSGYSGVTLDSGYSGVSGWSAASPGASGYSGQGVGGSVSTYSGAHTMVAGEWMALAMGSVAAFTIQLPTAVGIPGKEYVIKKTDSTINAIMVSAFSGAGQTIDGNAYLQLCTQWESISMLSDGANWEVK